MQKIIVVLGMHRSGTSLLTQTLKSLGCKLSPHLLNASQDNPDGFFEDYDIVMHNETLLSRLGCSWQNVYNLRLSASFNDLHSHIPQGVNLINKHKHKKPIWAFKDPRTAVLLPYWQVVFNMAEVVPIYLVAIRHPNDIAASLQKRDSIPLHLANTMTLVYWYRIIVGTAGYRTHFIDMHDLVSVPKSVALRLINEIPFHIRNREQHADAVAALVNPQHYHHSSRQYHIPPPLTEDFYRLLHKVSQGLLFPFSEPFNKTWHPISHKIINGDF